MICRDEIILEYIERLPYPPYPVQEEALYAWAACEQGVLLSAPTGTGKTLVAEAAVYEGLRTGTAVYYSTPLIALTDQKLLELQDTVARWGFDRDASASSPATARSTRTRRSRSSSRRCCSTACSTPRRSTSPTSARS